MNTALQSYCQQYIDNREILRQVYRFTYNVYLHPVCANVFCNRGQMADAEKIKECQQLVKDHTGLFSLLRGHLQPALVCLLSMEKDPQQGLARVKERYEQLKKRFGASEYLVLAAMMLPADVEVEPYVDRAHTLFSRMRKEHPFLTSTEDQVYAILMAYSQQSDDELITNMEDCYELLSHYFGKGNHIQALSHILALAPADPRNKVARIMELYDELHRRGYKYGKYQELTALAALSVLGEDARKMTEEIIQADEFLSTQKGYGFWGVGKKIRLMHAAMLVSNLYGESGATTAVMSTTLAMLVAQQTAAIAAASAAAAAANS